MRNIKQLVRFLAIPLAMMSFVLVASQAGGFVLRKDPPAKTDSSLTVVGKNPRG